MKLKVSFQEDNPMKVEFGARGGDFAAQFDPINFVTVRRNYDELLNRPSINEHLLVGGENSLYDLGIGRADGGDITRLFS